MVLRADTVLYHFGSYRYRRYNAVPKAPRKIQEKILLGQGTGVEGTRSSLSNAFWRYFDKIFSLVLSLNL